MPPRNDAEAWMWAQACALMSEAEQLQRQFFRLAATGRENEAARWEPPVDVFEDEREIVVVVAMPGVPADRVQVALVGADLVVRGHRPLPLGSARHSVRRLEIPHGGFERRVPLPPGRYEASRPEIADGCLVVRLGKLNGV